MARASTPTKLSLDRWAQLMGLSSMHFSGVYWPQHPPSTCAQPWLQRADQAVDRVGREEVAYAIAQAESDLEAYLGYRLMPTWETDEWRPSLVPWRSEFFNLNSADIRGFPQAVQARWRWAITGGVRAKSLVQADRAITYADNDGDSYKETATVTATVVSGQSPCEIRLYIRQTDVPGADVADDAYEIRPIKVTVSGVTATITFRREQCLKPSIYDDLVPPADDSQLRGADGSVDTNFLTLVDVYRVYNDPQTQATLMWEPVGDQDCGCNSATCALCAYATQTACLMIRGDPKNAFLSFRPGSWNQTNLNFDSEYLAVCRAPDIVRLYYYAGYRDKRLSCPTIQMAGELERAVAYYAAALLERPICECSNVRDFVQKWQTKPDNWREAAALENPFGTTEGAIFAWRAVNRPEAAAGRAILV